MAINTPSSGGITGRQKSNWRGDAKAGTSGGEKLISDYAGDVCHLTDPQTGKLTPVPISVTVLGARNYTYAEATPDLTLAH